MIMMIITCYNHNYIKKIQLQLHYNHVQMTRNHMALSIDDNDDLKENQQLQLQSHYNNNQINMHKHPPYINGVVRQSKYKYNFTLHYDNDDNYMLELQLQLH